MYACEEGYFDIVDILLQVKADPNLIDKYGNTALILASKNNHILCVAALLDFDRINQVTTGKRYMSSVREGKDILSAVRKDSHGLNARNYAQQFKVKKMINNYMIDMD